MALRARQVMRLAVSALLVAAAAFQTEGDSAYADSNSYADNSCSVGCPDQWVNDGMCDVSCNVEVRRQQQPETQPQPQPQPQPLPEPEPRPRP